MQKKRLYIYTYIILYIWKIYIREKKRNKKRENMKQSSGVNRKKKNTINDAELVIVVMNLFSQQRKESYTCKKKKIHTIHGSSPTS